MIERTNFFVASLWASLVPVGMLVLTCGALLVLPLPLKNDFLEPARRAAGLALILVPFAYTGLVVTTYGVARGLYAVRVLNRLALFIAYALLALAGTATFSAISAAIDFDAGSSTRAFVIILGLGLVSLLCAAWVWWQVACRPSPLDMESERRERRRKRREERRSHAQPTDQPTDQVTDR